MPGLRVRLLGGFEARLSSGTLLSLPAKKAQALLAYLGTRPGQAHPRDKLATLLWGETSDRQARGSLRHAVVTLRKALAPAHNSPAALRIDGQTLALDPEVVEVDVVTFERRARRGPSRPWRMPRTSIVGTCFSDYAERGAVRGVAADRAPATAGYGHRRPCAAPGGASPCRRHRGRCAGGPALARARSPARGRASHAHAALCPPGATGGRTQAVPAMRQRAASESWAQSPRRRRRRSIGSCCGGPAAGPGVLEPPGDRRSRPARAVGPAAPDFPAAETPLFGRQTELARLHQLLRAGYPGRRTDRDRAGRSGHRQDAARRRAGGRGAGAGLPGPDRALPRERLDLAVRDPGSMRAEVAGSATTRRSWAPCTPSRRAELARLLPEAGWRPGLPPTDSSPCRCSRAWPSSSSRSPPASRWCSSWRTCTGPTR